MKSKDRYVLGIGYPKILDSGYGVGLYGSLQTYMSLFLGTMVPEHALFGGEKYRLVLERVKPDNRKSKKKLTAQYITPPEVVEAMKKHDQSYIATYIRPKKAAR